MHGLVTAMQGGPAALQGYRGQILHFLEDPHYVSQLGLFLVLLTTEEFVPAASNRCDDTQ